MEYGGAYGFQHLQNTKLPCLGKKEIQEYLTKWSMIDGLKVQGYSFSKPFKTYLLDDFVQVGGCAKRNEEFVRCVEESIKVKM
jgi:hypothetical protein